MNDETSSSLQDAAAHAANDTIHRLTGQCDYIMKNILTWDNLFKLSGSLILIVAILFGFYFIKRSIKKVPEQKLSMHHSVLIRKLLNYISYIIILMIVMNMLNIKLSAIWGAAGIAGVALGFAAQTSVSNLISGLFVLGEKAMKVGDVVIVNGITGTVDSIGLLSTRIHTLDNQMVRIPNSAIINSNFQNNSFFPVRRFLFELSVSYSTDMEKALEILLKVPVKCPTVLADPAPKAWFDGFLDSGMKMVLAVWLNPSDLTETKNAVYMAIKKDFDAAGIEIPFNRLDVSILK